MHWKDYEIYIHKHFRKIFPDANISYNVRRTGIISKTKRQIDILVEDKIAGFDISVIIDCKYFNKKVDVKQVESFISFLHDLKASKGVLITNKGYSKAAFNRAANDTQDIELRIIDFNDLDRFQGFWAFAYSGKHCVFISAPPGWVVEANPPDFTPAALFPAGLSFDEAMKGEGLIYVNFLSKGKNIVDLKTAASYQEDYIKKTYPKAKFDYFNQDNHFEHKCLLRIADIDEVYQGLEYTYYIEYNDFVLFFVLLEPNKKSGEFLTKLKWVVNKHRIGKILFDSKSAPLSIKSI